MTSPDLPDPGTDIFAPVFYQPYEITWPEGAAGPIEVREFVDDGTPVREVRVADGEWRRFPAGTDIHL